MDAGSKWPHAMKVPPGAPLKSARDIQDLKRSKELLEILNAVNPEFKMQRISERALDATDHLHKTLRRKHGGP